MPHPSEALLLALADDALDAATHHETAAHVETCGACRQVLRDLRDATAALTVEVALLDATEPEGWRRGGVAPPRATPARPAAAAPDQGVRLSLVGADAEAARVRRGDPEAAPGRRRWNGTTSSAMRWAAIALVVVGGGAAAMTAPQWRLLVRGGAEPAASAPRAAVRTPAAAAPLPSASAAVSILPVDGEAVVSLLDLPPESRGGAAGATPAASRDASPAGSSGAASHSRVVVTTSDRRDVQVTVTSPILPGGASRVPRFLTGDGKLEVQLAGEGALIAVDFPSTLRGGRVTHDGRTVVSVRGSSVLPNEAAAGGVALSSER